VGKNPRWHHQRVDRQRRRSAARPTKQLRLAVRSRATAAASILLVGVGLYMRLRVLESPAFAEVKQTQAVRKLPVIDAFRHQWREILTSTFVLMSEQAPFYLFLTIVLAYGTTS
jgi:hypothetical protein